MKKILSLVILGLLIAGAGFYFWQHKGESQSGASGVSGAPSPPVAILEVKLQTIQISYELPGRISPYRQSQVRPQVDGIITERLFEEGANVEKGQQLYQIDDVRYKAALNSAKADLASARAKIKSVKAQEQRYRDLVKINAVSQQEYDDVKAAFDQAMAAVDVAQAAVDVAQVSLDYTKVYAPIAGRISRSFVTEGTLVTANQAQFMATITQLDPMYVDMQQSGSEAMQLRSRMLGKESVPVHLVADNGAGGSYPHDGALKFSEVTVDETTGSIALRALIPNPDSVLLPGLFVRAKIDLGQSKALLVPQRAVMRTPDGELTAWVVDQNNQVRPRPIQVEHAYKDQWIVKSGLQAGDRVIVEGHMKIAPGVPVSPTLWNGGSALEPHMSSHKKE